MPNAVIIPMGEMSFALQIPTRNIEFTEGQGSITVTVQASESSDYRVRADTKAIVMVTSGNPPDEPGTKDISC